MALLTELELPEFDYYGDAGLRGDRFHEVMSDLREKSWLAHSDLAYFVLDREAASFFLRTRSATFPGMKIAELFGIDEGPLFEEIRRNILHLKGADHRRLRNLVNPSPSLTIARVMGAPLDDAPRLHAWSNAIQRQFDAPSLANDREAIEQAVVEFYSYAGALLAARREEPADDLISTLLAAERGGDRLSEVECLNLVLNVLIGGVDTTQSQLAQGIRLFAEHPEQWTLLRAHPELVESAVEEILRCEPITPFTARIVQEDVTFGDVLFPEGTIVLVCAFAANRDLEPAAAGPSGPDAFDITGERGRARPLTFGAGVHFCLGANLARDELAEALAFLAARIARFELDGEPEYGSINGVYGLESLPVRFEAAATVGAVG